MKSLKELLDEIKGGKLKDADTLPKPKSFDIEKTINQSVGLGGGRKLDVKLGGSLGGSIALINSSDKSERVNDREGVLLEPTYDDPEIQQLMNPRSLLPYQGDSAYLCYRLGIQAGVSGASAIDLTALDFEAETKMSACFYSPHSLSGDQAQKKIGDAVLDDLGIDLDSDEDATESALKKIRNLFDSDAAGSLPVGSAMTFVASGNVRSSVSVDAGELLAGSMTYSGLFKEAIPFSYEAGFKLGASLEIGGDFYLGVAATGDDELTVVVRRSSARNIGLNGSLGVSAEVDFSATVGLINDFIGGITDLPKNRVETMLKAVHELVDSGSSGIEKFVNDLGGGQLPKAVSDLYDRLVEDLEGKLADWIEDKSDRILEPLEKLEDNLEAWQKQLQRYAKQKLELSFGFQYNKLDQSADLLRLTCTRAAFGRMRRDLLLFNIDIDSLGAAQGVKMERFLNLTIEEVSRSIGLNLRIGSWAFGSSVGSSKKWILLKDRLADDRVLRASYLGTRWYNRPQRRLEVFLLLTLDGGHAAPGSRARPDRTSRGGRVHLPHREGRKDVHHPERVAIVGI